VIDWNAAPGPDGQAVVPVFFAREALLGGWMVVRHSAPRPVKKLVWRISEEAPLGAWVDSTSAATSTAKTEPSEGPSDSWASSSFDLLHGVDVSENEDTVPAELLEELFQPHNFAAKGSGTK
jgi:hypothetical protein